MAVLAFPPLDFSLFGLSEWTGACWVEFFEGESGKPVWSVTLAHHSEDSALVLVRTSPKERWDRLIAGGQQPGAAEFAADLVRVVIDAARAEFDTDERSRYNRAVPAFAQDQGNGWESWESAQWSLDGHAIPARIWRFAHAWTGLTLGVSARYVGVTAFNVEDTEVDLTEVYGSDYGFDFTVPFWIHGLEDQLPRRPSTRDIYHSKRRHHDHDRVLDSQGPTVN